MFKEHMRPARTWKQAQFSPDEPRVKREWRFIVFIIGYIKISLLHAASNCFISVVGTRLTWCRKRISRVYYMLNDFLPSPAGVGGVKEGRTVPRCLPFITKHDFSNACEKFRRAPQAEGVSGFQIFVWNEICKAAKKKKCWRFLICRAPALAR